MSIKKIFAISVREWKSYFHTPIAMLIIPSFLALAGLYFHSIVVNFQVQTTPTERMIALVGMNVNDHVIIPFFKNILFLFLLIVPVITMRLLAEERRLATLALRKTYPVTCGEIGLGKYLGALYFIFLLLLLTIVYPMILFFVSQPEMGPLVSTYIGYVLFLMLYTAWGLYASSITDSQIIAALICFGGALSLYFFKWLAFISFPPLDQIVAHFLLIEHLGSFERGLMYLGDMAVYPSLTMLALLATYNRLRPKV